jgi:predicted small integral membrane protein
VEDNPVDEPIVGRGGYGERVTFVLGLAILVGTVLALGLCIVAGVAMFMVARSTDKLTFRQAFAMLVNREKPSSR